MIFYFFLYRPGFDLLAKTSNFRQYGQNNLIWADTQSGTNQEGFGTSQFTGTKKTDHTRYGINSLRCDNFSYK